VVSATWSAWLILALAPAPGMADPKELEFFETKIRPVLVEQCYACHSAEAATNKKLRGGLLLDSRAGLLKGGDGGPVIVASQPERSRLFTVLRHDGDIKMPPKGKLPDAVLADFKTWIERGAISPESSTTTASAIDWEAARKFWAFQPPVKSPPPVVRNASWPRTQIDAFLLAELEKRNLRPADPATSRELIRRLSFDMTGLPPTPEEVAYFETDTRPDAYERLVERLLASPQYGERWGRYWLDVVRYAEDKALAMAKPSPFAWRYRDWVVQAFNRDMPYDRFLRLQIAGDLLAEPTTDSFERLAGLGFQGLGAEYHKGNFAAQVMADELDDRIDTLARGLLGLTVACARCHDHKYDPIPTRDYYSLGAAYQGSSLSDLPLSPPEVVTRHRDWEKQVKELEEKLKKPAADPKELAQRKADLERLKQNPPEVPTLIHGVTGGGQAMRVYLRGNVERPGEAAPPGFLRILRRDSSPGATFTRLDLANAIATADNPLTARVIVNRVWHHHFGRGIVGTPSNFGKLGDRPTHPELLDTLALRFVENGWSLKWLHREILLSTAYRMSSASNAENLSRDAENLYLWRMTPRRLDIEAWRDSLLAVSGRLDGTVGGPSVELRSGEVGRKNVRRTVYARVSRSQANPLLALFDFPDANVTADRRAITTVPQQQLFVLNSEFMIETAKAFAARLERSGKDDAGKIDRAFRLAYGRVPTDRERELGLAFLHATPTGPRDKMTPWEQYAQALLATNEFLWVD
jgi:hypothetical protein